MHAVGAELADVLRTDPPHGVDYVGKTEDAPRITGDTAAGLPALLADTFAASTSVLVPSAPWYIAHSPLERVLAVIGLAAVAGLVVELVTRMRAPWPYMLAGSAWTVITVYVAIGPNASFLWHLGHALITGAFAVLVLTAWRLEARRQTS